MNPLKTDENNEIKIINLTSVDENARFFSTATTSAIRNRLRRYDDDNNINIILLFYLRENQTHVSAKHD